MDTNVGELDELEFEIEKRESGGYTLRLRYKKANTDSVDIEDPVPLTLPSPNDLQDAADDADDSDKPEASAGYGKILGDAVFADPSIAAKMNQVTGPARDGKARLRIVSREPEIQNLRWETIYFAGQPLFAGGISLSRYVRPKDTISPRPPWRPSLKALIFIASPKGIDTKPDPDAKRKGGDPARLKLAPIDVGLQRKIAEDNLTRGRAAGALVPIKTEFLGTSPDGSLPDAGTLNRLMVKLSEGFDILYLVCHGSIGTGRPVLYMGDGEGNIKLENAEEFAGRVAALLRQRAPEIKPRLIVLASCQSASALNAIGPLLAGAGIPAVIGMKGFITVKTVETFAPKLFAELRVDGQVDRAMAEARAAARNVGRTDYWMPVLFSSSVSGAILQPYSRGFEANEQTPWDTILEATKPEVSCVPVLGPDCLEPIWGSTSDIASWLAAKHSFPLEEHVSEDLPAVAHFLRYIKTPLVDVGMIEYLRNHWEAGVPNGPTADRFRELLKANESWNKPELPKPAWERLREMGAARRTVSRLEGGPEDLHRLLASLPYTLYLTACQDRLLEDALDEAGKKWKSDYPRWKASLWPRKDARGKDVFVSPAFQSPLWLKAGAPAAPNPDDHWEPSEKEPFVYHLFGDSGVPDSLVITEDDFNDYMLSINTEETARFTPSFVDSGLSSGKLLFLGFSLKDRGFQIVLRNTLRRVDPDPDRTWVGAQLPPGKDRYRRVDAARDYIDNNARTTSLKIYWGSTQDFVEDFGSRVRADPTLSEYLRPKTAKAGAA